MSIVKVITDPCFIELKNQVALLDIKKSRCNYFLFNKKDNSRCACGLLAVEHHPEAIYNYETYGLNKDIEWKPSICTIEDTITDAYGEISFDNREESYSKVVFIF